MRKILTFLISVLITCMLLIPIPTGYGLYDSSAPWPMYRHDVSHSGSTTSPAPNSNTTLWARGFSAGGLNRATTPIIIEGRVIFGVQDRIYAVDETNGVILWSHQTAGTLTAPSYVDGRVFLGISEVAGGVICVNASAGAEIWSIDYSPYFVMSSPLVNDGAVYVGVTDDYLRAYNATTGQYKWSFKTNGSIYGSAAADGNFVFFGSDDGNLYALDVSGSSPVSVWNFTANGPIRSAPAISGGKIFFGSDNNKLYALNENTGELIWSWATTEATVRIRNGVAVGDNIVYVTPESTSGYTIDMGKMFALNADAAPGNYTETDSSIVTWTRQFAGYLLTEPVFAIDKIIVNSVGGSGTAKLLALDATAGITVWYRDINWWPVLGNPVVADSRIWFSAYWWDPGSFTIYCIGDNLFPPTIYQFPITIDEQIYNIMMETNSTISNFNTARLQTAGDIAFNVEGIGLINMCNITIPNNLLGEPFSILVDSQPPLYSAPSLNNGTHTSLYFTYDTLTQHTVNVTGSLPLSVTVSPSSWAMDVGQSKVFTATASGGSGSYTSYQWYVDGVVQSGQTASTFTYSPTAAGSYSINVTVTDSLNATATLSSAIPVTVYSNPAVSVQPSIWIMSLGQSKNFTAVSGGGVPPYSYVWSVNFSVQPETSSSFLFTPSAVGAYTVSVTMTDSLGGIVGSYANVVVFSTPVAPTISASNSVIDQGQSITLSSSVVSTGVSPYSYQWPQKPPGASSYSDISGATSSAYNFVTTTSTTLGVWSFELQVTDSASSPATVTSSETTVTVNAISGIPEFPSVVSLSLLFLISLLAGAVVKRKRLFQK